MVWSNLDGSPTNVAAQALLAADKQTAQLKKLLRHNQGRLRFGPLVLQLHVQRCGTLLEVGTEPAQRVSE